MKFSLFELARSLAPAAQMFMSHICFQEIITFSFQTTLMLKENARREKKVHYGILFELAKDLDMW